jgi:hypothetical protein
MVDELALGRGIGIEIAQQRLVLLFVAAETGVGLNLDGADAQLLQRILDQMAVDDPCGRAGCSS